MKKSELLGDVVYPVIMIPFMAFIAVQVYQINARTAADHVVTIANAKQIATNQSNILMHVINHNDPTKVLSLGMPLVSFSDRRRTVRLEE